MRAKQVFSHALHEPSYETARELPPLWRLRAALYWDKLDPEDRQRLVRTAPFRYRLKFFPYTFTDVHALGLLLAGTTTVERLLLAPLVADIPQALNVLQLFIDDDLSLAIGTYTKAHAMFSLFPRDYFSRISRLPENLQRGLWQLAAGHPSAIAMVPYVHAVSASEIVSSLFGNMQRNDWIVFRTLLKLANVRPHPFAIADMIQEEKHRRLLRVSLEAGMKEETLAALTGQQNSEAFRLAFDSGEFDAAFWRAISPQRIVATLCSNLSVARHYADQLLQAYPNDPTIAVLTAVACKKPIQTSKIDWQMPRYTEPRRAAFWVMARSLSGISGALPQDFSAPIKVNHTEDIVAMIAQIPSMDRHVARLNRILLLETVGEEQIIEALQMHGQKYRGKLDFVLLAFLFKHHPQTPWLWQLAVTPAQTPFPKEQKRVQMAFITAEVPASWWGEEQVQLLLKMAPNIHDHALHTCPPDLFLPSARPQMLFHLLGSYAFADSELINHYAHILPFAFQAMLPEESSRWISAIVLSGTRQEETRWRLLPQEIKQRLMLTYPTLFSIRPKLQARLDVDKALSEMMDRLKL